MRYVRTCVGWVRLGYPCAIETRGRRENKCSWSSWELRSRSASSSSRASPFLVTIHDPEMVRCTGIFLLPLKLFSLRAHLSFSPKHRCFVSWKKWRSYRIVIQLIFNDYIVIVKARFFVIANSYFFFTIFLYVLDTCKS